MGADLSTHPVSHTLFISLFQFCISVWFCIYLSTNISLPLVKIVGAFSTQQRKRFCQRSRGSLSEQPCVQSEAVPRHSHSSLLSSFCAFISRQMTDASQAFPWQLLIMQHRGDRYLWSVTLNFSSTFIPTVHFLQPPSLHSSKRSWLIKYKLSNKGLHSQ